MRRAKQLFYYESADGLQVCIPRNPDLEVKILAVNIDSVVLQFTASLRSEKRDRYLQEFEAIHAAFWFTPMPFNVSLYVSEKDLEIIHPKIVSKNTNDFLHLHFPWAVPIQPLMFTFDMKTWKDTDS